MIPKYWTATTRSNMCPDKPYEPWPDNIIYEASDRLLVIKFNSGEEFNLPAEYLRVESPSAEVMGHNGKKNIVYGRKFVGITNIEEVGNYAIRLIFDDLHDTGIYTWERLYELGQGYSENWKRYISELDKKGLTREPWASSRKYKTSSQ